MSLMSKGLPEYYLITGAFTGHADFAAKLENSLKNGPRVVQLRCKSINDSDPYLELVHLAQPICARYSSPLILSTDQETFQQSHAVGLHLPSHQLLAYNRRPVDSHKMLSVSCHNEAEMQQAVKLGADLLLLSPVKETSSHPGVPGIGWKRFSELAKNFPIPVYALGGMKPHDLNRAISAGGRGVAAITGLWG